MSVNNSSLCVLAKKLHNIAPAVIIDDAAKVEELLVSAVNSKGWDGMAEALTFEEDADLSTWMKVRLASGQKVFK